MFISSIEYLLYKLNASTADIDYACCSCYYYYFSASKSSEIYYPHHSSHFLLTILTMTISRYAMASALHYSCLMRCLTKTIIHSVGHLICRRWFCILFVREPRLGLPVRATFIARAHEFRSLSFVSKERKLQVESRRAESVPKCTILFGAGVRVLKVSLVVRARQCWKRVLL